MERRGIAIRWSASLFELLHSLPDLLFQFLHTSLASGCRNTLMLGYLITSLYTADILFALLASTKIMPREETARRLELDTFRVA
jgi:hypothetical protein